MTARVPFAERGGAARGILDLVTGCYPAFLFGGSIGDQLPVFHFHNVTREWLEPRPVPPRELSTIAGRLEKIEGAVDAIALEVERISESQRFMTRLQSEQRPLLLPPPGSSGP